MAAIDLGNCLSYLKMVVQNHHPHRIDHQIPPPNKCSSQRTSSIRIGLLMFFGIVFFGMASQKLRDPQY
jgi:hypothetical protein